MAASYATSTRSPPRRARVDTGSRRRPPRARARTLRDRTWTPRHPRRRGSPRRSRAPRRTRGTGTRIRARRAGRGRRARGHPGRGDRARPGTARARRPSRARGRSPPQGRPRGRGAPRAPSLVARVAPRARLTSARRAHSGGDFKICRVSPRICRKSRWRGTIHAPRGIRVAARAAPALVAPDHVSPRPRRRPRRRRGCRARRGGRVSSRPHSDVVVDRRRRSRDDASRFPRSRARARGRRPRPALARPGAEHDRGLPPPPAVDDEVREVLERMRRATLDLDPDHLRVLRERREMNDDGTLDGVQLDRDARALRHGWGRAPWYAKSYYKVVAAVGARALDPTEDPALRRSASRSPPRAFRAGAGTPRAPPRISATRPSPTSPCTMV